VPKRQRRPGGGRKPIGEVRKSAALTARLEPQTRRALEEAAKKAKPKKLSVSRMAERILRDGLLRRPSGLPHNLALGCAVALVAEKIERDAGRNWRDDPFTQQAVSDGVVFLLAYFLRNNETEPRAPPAVEEAAARMPPNHAKHFLTPDGFGYVVGGNLINEIEQAATNPIPNEWTLPIFFSERPAQLAIIGRELITRKKAKGKSK
jgi:hypothetical protein